MHRPAFFILVAGLVALVAFAAPAVAEFIPDDWTLGNFDDSWPEPELQVGQTVTITGPLGGVGGSGSVTPDSMTIHGGNSGVKGDTLFSTTAAFSGVVSIEWHYLTSDSLCFDNGGYMLNDVFTAISCNNGPFLGSTTFDVNAGDTFGFGVRTGDGQAGPGTLIVTSYSFVPTPGATALIGLLALRRRRRRA